MNDAEFREVKAKAEEALAEVERAKADIAALRKLIDRDRTGLAAALNKVRGTLQSYSWLARGEWGSYTEDQQTTETMRQEFERCFEEVLKTAEDALTVSGTRANQAFQDRPGNSPTPAYLIRHRPSDLWWRPNRNGYTAEILNAGVYSKTEADSIATIRPPQDELVLLADALANIAPEPKILAALTKEA